MAVPAVPGRAHLPCCRAKKKNASNKDDTGCKGYPLCSKQREGIEGIIVMVKIENRVRQSNGALKHNMGIVSR